MSNWLIKCINSGHTILDRSPHTFNVANFRNVLSLSCSCSGGSRISKEGVQMYKRGVRLPNFTQHFLKFPMKIK